MRKMIQSLAAAALTAALGCGGDSTASLDIAVEFPGQAAELSTNSLHFWVLEPIAAATEGDAEAPPAAGCRELELGDAGPYDLVFARRADLVVVTAEAQSVSAEELPRHPALVYVEGVDYFGNPEIAGCESVDIGGGASSVTVALRNRGALDCADPETPDGAPCDDGMFCTVGETCQGGQCQGGAPRDCTHVADDCNGESCSEELGCQPQPVPDDTPCSDGLFCSAGDSCQQGVCTAGADRDCGASADDCNLGVCDESGSACVSVPTNEGGECACDNGTTTGTCVTGTCGDVEGPLGDATCADGLDNDCDGAVDDADTGCQ